jgi:GR25 family glycosyltransferase involved in LPS biosynthesis
MKCYVINLISDKERLKKIQQTLAHLDLAF